ncbi:polynucleotide kinase [Epibacterium sp. SM1979]|uniref:Polynucleotide kinase n=1 Tax=Tritonibacter litoralis TaxID=2662264 RepID=A0A843YJ88_9RHOB|nr:HAD family acid phosphatase [Tritonibacter litoralis]MQQ09303.1 polynucleotide kinase [Tritonibacter litoralis]
MPDLSCAIFDIDGTLAEFDADKLGHLVHGVDKHWDAFHDAMAETAVIEPVARVMRHLHAAGEKIVLCSGRPRGWQAQTEAWLIKNNLPFDAVYLRHDGTDAMSDPDVKHALLEEMRGDGYAPWIVFDDRSSVVAFWRAQGLICLQCAAGDF